MSLREGDAVLLGYHGSITNLSDMPAFLSNIRRGRPAPRELVEEITARYERIGGSPLVEQTASQARTLEARLGIPVRAAGRLWGPYPGEVLADLAKHGAKRVLSLPLAPQSVHVYHEAARTAVGVLERAVELVLAPAWGAEPALIDAFVESIEEAISRAPGARPHVLLTAHSLPLRVLAAGDPYEAAFRAMANLVKASIEVKLGLEASVAFQSQGASAEPWLGPDLPTALRGVRAAGIDAVVVAPIGFLAEHVETLYDLDVEGPLLARDAGIATFLRAPAVGQRPRFIDALESVARGALATSD
ncbi:MAG: ferrochelatase [Polyangiaceae bacterium]